MKKLILTENQYKKLLSEITSEEIMAETEKVNLNPTDLQKEAGNYAMGHISVKGMKIAIENPIGSKRYYTEDGEKKYNVMKNHYGYFNVTKGKDGDAVDVFIGPDIEDFENVYCVDQSNDKGEFDETKVMLGFKSKKDAKKAYFANFSPGWDGFMSITGVSLKVFKKWLYRGRKQRQPFADYVYIKKKQLQENRLLKEEFDKINNALLLIKDKANDFINDYSSKDEMSQIDFLGIVKKIVNKYKQDLTQEEKKILDEYIKTKSYPELEDKIFDAIKEKSQD